MEGSNLGLWGGSQKRLYLQTPEWNEEARQTELPAQGKARPQVRIIVV